MDWNVWGLEDVERSNLVFGCGFGSALLSIRFWIIFLCKKKMLLSSYCTLSSLFPHFVHSLSLLCPYFVHSFSHFVHTFSALCFHFFLTLSTLFTHFFHTLSSPCPHFFLIFSHFLNILSSLFFHFTNRLFKCQVSDHSMHRCYQRIIFPKFIKCNLKFMHIMSFRSWNFCLYGILRSNYVCTAWLCD